MRAGLESIPGALAEIPGGSSEPLSGCACYSCIVALPIFYLHTSVVAALLHF